VLPRFERNPSRLTSFRWPKRGGDTRKSSSAASHPVLFEPDAGFLLARRACEHIVERVVAEGGEYVQAAVAAPVRLKRGQVSEIALTGRTSIAADAVISQSSAEPRTRPVTPRGSSS
jgi:hypothetical protein